MEDFAPLISSDYNESFRPFDISDLSIESIDNNVPKLESIPKVISPNLFSQNNFNFRIDPPVGDKPLKTEVSLEDAMELNLQKLYNNGGDYGGAIPQRDAILYDDPILGYGTDRNNEDIYSRKGNFYNALNKTFNSSINWTKKNLYEVGDIWNAAKNMDASLLYNNDSNRQMAEDVKTMQYLYPIYRSLDAQENPNKFWATGNMANHLTNFDMIIGTVVGTLIQDYAIALGGAVLAPSTEGASLVGAAGLVYANTGRKLFQLFKNINLVSNIISDVNKARNLVSNLQKGEKLVSLIKNSATLNNFGNFSKRVLIDSVRASGEAGFEAYNAKAAFREKMLRENPNISIEELDKSSDAIGMYVYGMNQTVLNLSNRVTYGKLLSGKMLTNTMKNLPLLIKADLVKGTLDLIEQKGFKGFLNGYYGRVTKDVVGNMLSEGFEEGLQYSIEKGVSDYYENMFSGKKGDLVESVSKGLGEMFSEEGLSNIIGGMFIGGLSSVGGIGFSNAFGLKTDTNKKAYEKALKEYKDAFSRTDQLFNFASNNLNAVELNGKSIFEAKNEYDTFVHNFTMFGIKQGNLQAKLDALEEFKSAKPEDFTEYTGIKVNDQQDISNVIDSIKNRVEITTKSYNEIQSVFAINPYLDTNDSYVKTKLKELAKITNKPEDQIAAVLWEHAKEQSVKSLVDLKNYSKRENDLFQEVLGDIQDGSKADLLKLFVESPIGSLNDSLTKLAEQESSLPKDMESFLAILQKNIEENKSTIENLGADLTAGLLEMQEFNNSAKFYKNIRSLIKEGDVKGFYTEFYKYLTNNQGTPNEDLETEINSFILKTTDLINLNLGKTLLADTNIQLRNKKGQKKLIEENIKNFQFYTYVESLKEKEKKGEISNLDTSSSASTNSSTASLPAATPPTAPPSTSSSSSESSSIGSTTTPLNDLNAADNEIISLFVNEVVSNKTVESTILFFKNIKKRIETDPSLLNSLIKELPKYISSSSTLNEFSALITLKTDKTIDSVIDNLIKFKDTELKDFESFLSELENIKTNVSEDLINQSIIGLSNSYLKDKNFLYKKGYLLLKDIGIINLSEFSLNTKFSDLGTYIDSSTNYIKDNIFNINGNVLFSLNNELITFANINGIPIPFKYEGSNWVLGLNNFNPSNLKKNLEDIEGLNQDILLKIEDKRKDLNLNFKLLEIPRNPTDLNTLFDTNINDSNIENFITYFLNAISEGDSALIKKKELEDKIEQLKKIVEQNNSKLIKTESGYLLKDEPNVLLNRVSSLTPNFFTGDSDASKIPIERGNLVDELVREFFNGNIPVKPDNMSDKAFSDLMKRLNDIDKSLKENNRFFLTNNIIVFDKDLGIAGELDILSVDEFGDYHIYDIKTSKSFTDYEKPYNSTSISKKSQHTNQLSVYKQLFENLYKRNINQLVILPFEVNGDSNLLIKDLKPIKAQILTYNYYTPLLVNLIAKKRNDIIDDFIKNKLASKRIKKESVDAYKKLFLKLNIPELKIKLENKDKQIFAILNSYFNKNKTVSDIAKEMNIANDFIYSIFDYFDINTYFTTDRKKIEGQNIEEFKTLFKELESELAKESKNERIAFVTSKLEQTLKSIGYDNIKKLRDQSVLSILSISNTENKNNLNKLLDISTSSELNSLTKSLLEDYSKKDKTDSKESKESTKKDSDKEDTTKSEETKKEPIKKKDIEKDIDKFKLGENEGFTDFLTYDLLYSLKKVVEEFNLTKKDFFWFAKKNERETLVKFINNDLKKPLLNKEGVIKDLTLSDIYKTIKNKSQGSLYSILNYTLSLSFIKTFLINQPSLNDVNIYNLSNDELINLFLQYNVTESTLDNFKTLFDVNEATVENISIVNLFTIKEVKLNSKKSIEPVYQESSSLLEYLEFSESTFGELKSEYLEFLNTKEEVVSNDIKSQLLAKLKQIKKLTADDIKKKRFFSEDEIKSLLEVLNNYFKDNSNNLELTKIYQDIKSHLETLFITIDFKIQDSLPSKDSLGINDLTDISNQELEFLKDKVNKIIENYNNIINEKMNQLTYIFDKNLDVDIISNNINFKSVTVFSQNAPGYSNREAISNETYSLNLLEAAEILEKNGIETEVKNLFELDTKTNKIVRKKPSSSVVSKDDDVQEDTNSIEEKINNAIKIFETVLERRKTKNITIKLQEALRSLLELYFESFNNDLFEKQILISNTLKDNNFDISLKIETSDIKSEKSFTDLNKEFLNDYEIKEFEKFLEERFNEIIKNKKSYKSKEDLENKYNELITFNYNINLSSESKNVLNLDNKFSISLNDLEILLNKSKENKKYSVRPYNRLIIVNTEKGKISYTESVSKKSKSNKEKDSIKDLINNLNKEFNTQNFVEC